MQVGASAGQHLMHVNLNHSVMGHHTQQQSLLLTGPAPYARTSGTGHRHRLTRPGMRSIPSHVRGNTHLGLGPLPTPRSPSCDGLRVLIRPIVPTFPSQDGSRLAAGEVQSPLRPESPADSDGSTLQQRISYPLQRSQRLLVDALRGDDHQPPAHLVEFLPPEDVGQPLLSVLSMLTAVVLNDQTKALISQVIALSPAAVATTKDQIDARFRQTSKDQEQTEPCLLR